jgi:hypothetical protein
LRGVEGRREVDAALRAPFDNLIGLGLGRGVPVGQVDLDPVAREEAGRFSRVALGQEPRIVVDDQGERPVRQTPFEDVRDGLDDEPDVLEGELFAHHGPPAGGAELDHGDASKLA